MVGVGAFEAILADVSAGIAVRKAIVAHGCDTKGFYALLASDPELGKRYARAKEAGCHAYADETYEIQDEKPPMVESANGAHVDTGWVQWQRNRVELRRWHLGKLLPKVYGDRTILAGDADNPLVVDDPKGALLRGLVPHAGPPGTGETDR